MMKISRKSWHARLYAAMSSTSDWNMLNNLCEYFREIVINVSFVIFIGVVATAMVISWLFLIPLLIHLGSTDSLFDLKVYSMFCGIWWAGNYAMFRFLSADKPMIKFKTPEIVKLVTAYVKAKTGKYCPKIEWID